MREGFFTREEQAPPLPWDGASKNGFSLGRSCLRSRLMRGKLVVSALCHLIRHDFVVPPSPQGEGVSASSVRGRLKGPLNKSPRPSSRHKSPLVFVRKV